MTQNNFDTTVAATPQYWVAALGNEMEALWGGVEYFKGELEQLCYSAALTSYLDSAPADLDYRYRIQREYMKGVFTPRTLNRYARMMPLGSFASKALRNICTAYNRPPERIWEPENDAANQRFKSIYTEMGADRRFQDAYRYARLCNVVAVRPWFNSQGRMRTQVLPPDMFRVVTDLEFPDEVRELWIPYARMQADGKPRTTFKVWSAEESRVVDYCGQALEAPRPNPYGRIPYAFIRLAEPNDGDFYGSGWWQLVAANVWNNVMRLTGNRNYLYNNFSILVATNMYLRKEGLTMAPGEILEQNDVGEGVAGVGQPVPPRLEQIRFQGQYLEGDQWRQGQLGEFFRNEGLPGFYFEEMGTPPSGAALKVMERELERIVEADKLPLRQAERDFAELVAVVYNRDRVTPLNGGEALPERLPGFSIDYTEEPVYLEPGAEFALDKEMADAGLLRPARLYRKWTGDDNPRIDEQAAELMCANRALYAAPFGSPGEA